MRHAYTRPGMISSPVRRRLLMAAGWALASLIVLPSLAVADDQAVSMVDLAFTPAEVTVAAGEVVTWSNDAGQGHTATADDGSFDSAEIGPGDRFVTVFAEAGVYAYHCTIHPRMTGRVIVEATVPSTSTLEPTPLAGTPPPSPTARPTTAPTPDPAASPTLAPRATANPPAMFRMDDPAVVTWVIGGLTAAIGALVVVMVLSPRRR